LTCLNVSQVPPAQRDDAAREAAILLFDVFNRIPIPPLEEVPDEPEMERRDGTRWRVPHTPITIARVEEGARAGEWLFTPETVDDARSYYRRTRHLPLKPDAVVRDGYRIYLGVSGWLIPASWLAALPDWAHEVYLEQTVWQWGGLLFVLAVLLSLALGVVRWSRRAPPRERPSAGRALIGPISLILILGAALYVIDEQLNITGIVLVVIRHLLNSLSFLAMAWGTLLVGRLVVDVVHRSPRFHPQTLNEQFVRVSVRLLVFFALAGIFAVWLHSLGVPVFGVIAGLGIGGIAIALGAQRTIENFFGAFTIFADRPVRVGDFCRFGDQMGTVESIGLRSTRIRTLERSVLTIPNAEFARFQLDNLALRDRMLMKTTLNLRLETTTEQLERVLRRVRELLIADERVYDDPARIRLVAVGPLSLDLEIFAYIKTSNTNEFLAIREELFMKVLGVIEEAGTALAPPAVVQYNVEEEDWPSTQQVEDAPT
jgi:MscS family membrane protein